VKLEDVPGIGPKTAEKLREHGVEDVEDLIASQPAEIAKILGVSAFKAKELIASAKELLMSQRVLVQTAEELEEFIAKNVRRFSTGSKALDEILGGGVPSRAITTFSGPYSTGKTQLCLQLVANAIDQGLYAAWIETEPGTFSPKRLKEIAEKRGLSYDPKRLLVVPAERIASPAQQLLAYEAVWKRVRDENLDLGVFVVDSFSAKIRAHYTGRETLSARSQETARHIGLLELIAASENAAVVLTAQVMGIPDMSAQLEARVRFGAPMRTYGGEFFLHSSQYIVFLTQVASDVWEAYLVDAPDLPKRRARFRITEKGIEDA